MKKIRLTAFLLVVALCISTLSSCSVIENLTGAISGVGCELLIDKVSKTYKFLDSALVDATAAAKIGKNAVIKLNQNYVSTGSVCLPECSTRGSITLDLNGFTLSRKLSDYKDNGEVINISKSGNFVITDSVGSGSITGGKNTTSGGGIYCEISNGTSVTFDNIKVTGNASKANAGGIYIKRIDSGDNTVKLSGTVNVSENTNGNLSISAKSGAQEMLNVSDLSDNSAISFDIEEKCCNPFVYDENEDAINNVIHCFTADNSDYQIEKRDNNSVRMRQISTKGANLICEGKEYHYDVIAQAWLDANSADKFLNKSVEVLLNEDWISDNDKNLSYGIESPKYGFANGRLWPAARPDGCTLTLNLCGNTIDRRMGAEDRDYGNIISIEKTAVITIKNGTLTGGHNDKDGGAIYVDAAAAYVTLDNLYITANKSDNSAGGIYCTGNANHLTIKDCTITGNESNDIGGGMYIYLKDSTDRDILFTGIVIIKDNYCKYYNCDSDVYISNYNATARMAFPTLKDGSHISIYARSTDSEITLPAEDSYDNRDSLSYFYPTHPLSVNIPFINYLPNDMICLGMKDGAEYQDIL